MGEGTRSNPKIALMGFVMKVERERRRDRGVLEVKRETKKRGEEGDRRDWEIY